MFAKSLRVDSRLASSLRMDSPSPWWGACFSFANSDSTPATDDVVSVRFRVEWRRSRSRTRSGLQFQFKWKQTVGTLYFVFMYFAAFIQLVCICNASWLSSVLKDTDGWTRTESIRVCNCRCSPQIPLQLRQGIWSAQQDCMFCCTSMNECQMVWTMADLTIFGVGVN